MKKSATTCVFYFCLYALAFSQSGSISLNEDVGGHGSEILVTEENGEIYMIIQPDFDGEGGYFQVNNGNGSYGFRVNGNFSNGNSLISMQGTESVSLFNTDETGDAAVVLPIDAINSSEIENEVGVANMVGTVTTLVDTFRTILTQTIDAPTTGYILAIASGRMECVKNQSVEDETAQCGISTSPSSISTYTSRNWEIPSIAAEGGYQIPFSVSGLYQVTNPGPNTFYFIGREIEGDGFRMWNSNLSLVFIPTNYGTTTSTMSGGHSLSIANNEDLQRISAGITKDEINSIRQVSIQDNQLRMQKEIDELRQIIDELRLTQHQTDQ